MLEVLGLAHRYGFVELESSISDYLKAVLNIRNVCLIFDIASMYNLKSLCETCCEFMDRNASDIIQSENFFTLSPVSTSAVSRILVLIFLSCQKFSEFMFFLLSNPETLKQSRKATCTCGKPEQLHRGLISCNLFGEILHALTFLLQTALQEVISRDSFCAQEIEIFRAVQQWSVRNPDEEITSIVRQVRLPLMDLDELLNVVRESGMISADAILDAIKTKNQNRNMELNYRGFLSKLNLMFGCLQDD